MQWLPGLQADVLFVLFQIHKYYTCISQVTCYTVYTCENITSDLKNLFEMVAIFH